MSKRTIKGHTVEQIKDSGLSLLEIDGEFHLTWRGTGADAHYAGFVRGPELKILLEIFPNIQHDGGDEPKFDEWEAQYYVSTK